LPYPDVKGGYPQTKWVAEKLMINIRKYGVPTCIYRPGYITGHSISGVWNPDDFLCRMIKGTVQLGSYPNLSDVKLDMSPVDFVAKSIIYMVLTKDSILKHKAYHLVNPHEFYFNAMFECANRLGYQVKSLNFMKWKMDLFESVQENESIDEQNALYPLLTYFTDDYESKMKIKRPWYDNTFTLEILFNSGISCPPVIELLGTYYSFLCRCGFLKPPSFFLSKY
jgi:thioester reductase-like protein